MSDIIWIIILLLFLLVLVFVFKLVDAYINAKPKEKVKKQTADETPPVHHHEINETHEIKETHNNEKHNNEIQNKETQEVVLIQEHKSLADEMEKEIAKSNQQTANSGRPPHTRIHTNDRIKRFRATRNYVEYDDFSNKTDPADDSEEALTSTDEYKKIMALVSKPLSNS
ncbi:MAG: hypothetical protein LBQ05_01990 [Christensenellaceae bacterium]|jgi:hypothetical protein|nr:hypothetical protein [Christensenellaceae bacterium]